MQLCLASSYRGALRSAGARSWRPRAILAHRTLLTMKPLVLVGALMAILGLGLFVYPAITTQETKEVAKVGPLHVDKTDEQTHFIPPLLSGGILVIGVVVLTAGLVRDRG